MGQAQDVRIDGDENARQEMARYRQDQNNANDIGSDRRRVRAQRRPRVIVLGRKELRGDVHQDGRALDMG